MREASEAVAMGELGGGSEDVEESEIVGGIVEGDAKDFVHRDLPLRVSQQPGEGVEERLTSVVPRDFLESEDALLHVPLVVQLVTGDALEGELVGAAPLIGGETDASNGSEDGFSHTWLELSEEGVIVAGDCCP